MLASLQQPAITLPPAVANSSSAPRKRRRRAPATGAAEDCFTCRANATKCDRRRPYCGPCLEVGNECKGYRTQLTWGVGVASRGKLRGMTLPISIESNISVVERDRLAAARKKEGSTDESASKAKRVRTSLDMSSQPNGSNRQIPGEVGKLSIITNYDFINMEHPSTSPSAVGSCMSRASTFPRMQKSPLSNGPSPYSPQDTSSLMIPTGYPSEVRHRHEYPSSILQYHKSPYSPSAISSHSPSTIHFSPSVSDYDRSYDSHGTDSYSLPPTPESPLYDGGHGSSSAYLPVTTAMTITSNIPSYAPLLTTVHHEAHMMNNADVHQQHSNQQWSATTFQHQVNTNSASLPDLMYTDGMLAPYTFTSAPLSAGVAALAEPTSFYPQNTSAPTQMAITAPQLPPQLLMPHLTHLAPELRFLIDYYDKIVCASIVAFDGPTNPYRTHVLRLAFQNEALMQAVYALATSHLQQRRKAPLLEERRSSPPLFSSRSSTKSPRTSTSPPPLSSRPISTFNPFSGPNEAFAESQTAATALRYKNTSIKLLNNQLADSSLAVTDAAMATLLILCLYHVCETGVGQFRTHLAGVKKLMGMRGVGKETGRWGWMETVFTWFDNMSASVNNREAQLRGGYLDMIEECTENWDLESLTGCNRYLFMRLAGLGRINILSQQPPTVYFKRSHHQQTHFDDDDDEPPRNENDGRDEFWLAWNAMKSDLLTWKPCTTYAATPSRHKAPDSAYSSVEFDFSQGTSSPTSSSCALNSTGLSSPNRKSSKAHEAVEKNHWLHASNVYRYAAILYLDRLAYPHLPSSHNVFQKTVRVVLDHLNCIPSSSGLSKLLLWPLFVTGTECVVDEHRILIRERCFDMQRDCGFFNKMSGLDVLESIWSEDSEDEMYGFHANMEAGRESIGGRGLKWRRVTQKEDGEYLMI